MVDAITHLSNLFLVNVKVAWEELIGTKEEKFGNIIYTVSLRCPPINNNDIKG